jgi:hypothetical protein
MKRIVLVALVVGACAGPMEVPDSYPASSTAREAEPGARSRRDSRVTGMMELGLVGALVGGYIGRAGCDDLHETDEECEQRAIEGVLIGGGIGVLMGAMVDPD